MKKAILAILIIGLCGVPFAVAQDHGEVGAFADYVRLQPSSTDHYGVGGRLSINVHPVVALEAEMSYDFSHGINETFSNAGSTPTGSATVTRTRLRILHGLFGPKFQIGTGAIRAFGTVKGGIVNFRLDARPATFSTFTSSIDDLRRNNVDGALYPGGGVEFYAGPIGIRGDVGDLIYFNNGAHNNLRVAIGPSIRF